VAIKETRRRGIEDGEDHGKGAIHQPTTVRRGRNGEGATRARNYDSITLSPDAGAKTTDPGAGSSSLGEDCGMVFDFGETLPVISNTPISASADRSGFDSAENAELGGRVRLKIWYRPCVRRRASGPAIWPSLVTWLFNTNGDAKQFCKKPVRERVERTAYRRPTVHPSHGPGWKSRTGFPRQEW
jgi:hypothetical protein